MNKSKRMQQPIMFFLALAFLAIVLLLAFMITVNTSVNAAYEPAPTLAVPPTYTISPTPDI